MDLQAEDGGDRPWGGAISFGIHSPFQWTAAYVLGGGCAFYRQELWFDAVSAGPSQRVRESNKQVIYFDQIKDETVIGGAAEVAYPIGVTDRVQARPFGEMRTGLEDVARIGVDVYFGALDSTPAMSRDPVTGHRYPVNVEQAQDRGMLFSLGYDYTQVENHAFFHQFQMPAMNPHALGHGWA